MPKPEQCCGTCRWWDHGTAKVRPTMFYPCDYPLPENLPISATCLMTTHGEGRDCPCWQAKESEAKRDG